MNRRRAGFTRQWGWPIALAVLTCLGLLSALIGEAGGWRAFSWIALAMPCLMILRHIWPQDRR